MTTPIGPHLEMISSHQLSEARPAKKTIPSQMCDGTALPAVPNATPLTVWGFSVWSRSWLSLSGVRFQCRVLLAKSLSVGGLTAGPSVSSVVTGHRNVSDSVLSETEQAQIPGTNRLSTAQYVPMIEPRINNLVTDIYEKITRYCL